MFTYSPEEKKTYSNSPYVIAGQYKEWLETFEFNYFVTLTYKYEVRNKARIERDLNQLTNHLNRAYYGKHRAKHGQLTNPSFAQNLNRLVFVSAIESHAAGDYHAHMLFIEPSGQFRNNPPKSFEEAISKHWKSITQSYNIDVQKIDKNRDNLAVGYLLKEFPYNQDNLNLNNLRVFQEVVK